LEWLCKHSNGEYDEWKSVTHEQMDELNVPKRTLSCSFTMRSNDICCGTPFNIAQYAMLTYMLCEVCNMVPGELVYYAGDAHVYTNHITNAKEQLSRNGSEIIPKLRFTRKINDINDFKFEDFIVEDYYPDAAIKYELNVGL
jgi:thymidylate synthase